MIYHHEDQVYQLLTSACMDHYFSQDPLLPIYLYLCRLGSWDYRTPCIEVYSVIHITHHLPFNSLGLYFTAFYNISRRFYWYSSLFLSPFS
jgi:hypothetical protein